MCSSGVPVITAFSPISGPAGSTVTITGLNFSATPSNNIVYFGAVRAAVTAASAMSLTVTAPTGATYAPITVTVNGLVAYANAPFMPTFTGIGQIDNSSLGPQVVLPTGNGPGQVVIVDLDGDGKPDLIIADSYAGEISIYQNISTNGSLTAGSFAPRVVLPMLAGVYCNPYTVAVADLDGDGRLDIIAINADSNVVSILRNISSPGSITTNSFAARVDLPAGNGMRGLAVQDLNGDGRPEIVTADAGDNTISIFQNMSTIGNIAFAPRVSFPAGNWAQSVAIGDLDGDGKPDLAVASRDSATVSIFRNIMGPGNNITTNSFAPKVDFPALASAFPIAIGDMDGDGKLDLVVGGGNVSKAISVYRNTATVGSITTNSFASRVDFAAPGWVNSLTLADLDGDGKLDIALVSQISSVFSIFKNVSVQGSFTTASLAARVDYSTGWNPNGIAVGDLDGDGRPDIVFANTYDANIFIYQNIVPFGGPPVITSQPTNQSVYAGDTATFTVAATGAQPLSYQWYFNTSTPLTNATNATLTLTNVQVNQAGTYSVLASNVFGSILSSNAMLAVNPLNHFAWSVIPSPQFVDMPFQVTVTAQDPSNNTVTNFSDTVTIIAPILSLSGQVCDTVPAASDGGTSFGSVVAGQTYIYQASGCCGRDAGCGGSCNTSDPDGNVYSSGDCSGTLGTGMVASEDFVCPGLKAWSLVGIINGGDSVQLGSSGSFVAPVSGSLILYFNDDYYGDNSGSWNVCLTPVNYVALTPTNAGPFTEGVWSGNITVQQPVTNVVLRADDGNGHFGLANSISVISVPRLEMENFGDIMLFSWPVESSGFVLETSTTIAPATCLRPYAPLQIGDEYVVPLDMSGPQGFYRLRFSRP